MTRDDARQKFKDSGLTYAVLSHVNVHRLCVLIDVAFAKRPEGNRTIHTTGDFWLGKEPRAAIRCKSDWFEDREAVSFHSDGMIGFAGWADDGNIEPIVRAFCVWCDEMRKADPISQVLDKVEAAFEEHCPTHTTEVEALSDALFDIRRAAE